MRGPTLGNDVSKRSSILVAASIAFFALAASMEHAEPATVVTLVLPGQEISLSDQERAQIADSVRSLMVGCSIDSMSEPQIFFGRTLSNDWPDTLTGPHLYVRFPEPLQAMKSAVKISEVAIGFSDPNFIGPELSRDGEDVVGHVKCSGHRALALMCVTALRPHLLPGQLASCVVYDRIGPPK